MMLQEPILGQSVGRSTHTHPSPHPISSISAILILSLFVHAEEPFPPLFHRRGGGHSLKDEWQLNFYSLHLHHGLWWILQSEHMGVTHHTRSDSLSLKAANRNWHFCLSPFSKWFFVFFKKVKFFMPCQLENKFPLTLDMNVEHYI